MSYLNIFGGSVIQPAYVSYLNITPFTANMTLSWPAQFQDTQDVVAEIIDLNPSVGGLHIRMPDATQTSVGQQVLFNNYGSSSVAILADDGITGITTVAPGNIIFIYLIDNTTTNGTWRATPWGSGGGGFVTSVGAEVDIDSIDALTITSTTTNPITSSGTFIFTLSNDLNNISELDTNVGWAVRTANTGTWATRTFLGSSNISITHPDGILGNPTFTLNPNVVIDNLRVGNLYFDGSSSTISSTSGPLTLTTAANAPIYITPNGSGNLYLGSNALPVIIDTNNNILNVNNVFADQFNTEFLQIFGNTIASITNHDINIFPNGTGSVNLGSNGMPVKIDPNNNITNVNVITAVEFDTSLLRITGNTITSITNNSISISPNGTGNVFLGSNPMPVTVDTNNNITNVNTLQAVQVIGGNIDISGNTITSTSGAINIFPASGQNLNLGSNGTPITIDTNDNITNVHNLTASGTITGDIITATTSVTAPTITATTALTTTFNPSPLVLGYIYFDGTVGIAFTSFNAIPLVQINGVGDYTIHWSITLPSSVYVVVATADMSGITQVVACPYDRTNSTTSLTTKALVTGLATSADCSVTIFG